MIKLYFLTLAVFLGIDAVWLTVISKNFYAKQLGFLMAKKVNLGAAGIFYLLFVLGIVILVLSPAIEKGSIKQAILMGGLFGLCSYATYDLTNLATIENWPLIVTVVDIVWGTVLGIMTAGISYWLQTKI